MIKRISFIILLIPFIVFGQSPRVFRALSVNEGLSQSGISGIAQDKFGYMWFTTQYGINRYDGYDVDVYNIDREGVFYIPDYIFEYIIQLSNGDIMSDGYVFDSKKNRFKYAFSEVFKRKISTSNTKKPILDYKNNFWQIGSYTLKYFNADSTEGARLLSTLFSELKNKYFSKILIESDHLWMLHNNSNIVEVLDLKAFYDNRIRDGIKTFYGKNNISYIFSLKGKIYFAGWDGVIYNCYNDSILFVSDAVTKVKHETALNKQNRSGGEIKFRSVVQDQFNDIWIGTYGKGLFQLDSAFKLKNHYSSANSNLSNNITCLYIDKTGVLWIGTTNNGVFSTDLYAKKFKTYRSISYKKNSLPEKSIAGISYDRNGLIWAASGNDITFIDEKSDTIADLKIFPNQAIKRILAGFYAIIPYEDGCMLAVHKGVCKFNLEKKAIQISLPNDKDSTKLASWVCWTAHKGQKTGIYYVATINGLYRMSKPDNSGMVPFQDTDMPEKFTYLKNREFDGLSISALYEDQDGILWVGAHNGLFAYDQSNNSVQSFKADENNKNTLSHKSVKSILVDSKNFIWVGTEAGGVNKYDKKTGRFYYYTNKQGLSNNSVIGILEDNQHRIWVSTKKGLNCINPQTGCIKNYFDSDGLQGNEYNYFSYCKMPDGRLCFGGVDGLTIFKPEEIDSNPFPPRTIITNLYLFNKVVQPGDCINGDTVLSEVVSQTKEIRLSHKNKIISFKFAGLHFASPEYVKYRYKLEGFDDEWREASSGNRMAHYTNLPAGKYIFKVKSANKDDVWDESGKCSLVVIIKPPWWETIWFRISMLILLILAIGSIFLGRIKQMEHQKKRLQKLVDEQTKEIRQQSDDLRQANSTKDKFFSIISHDLKNPMYGINGVSQLLVEHGVNMDKKTQLETFNMLNDSSKRVISLLENLLNWARSQSGKIDFKPESFDLSHVVVSTLELLQMSASNKGLVLVSQIPEGTFVIADKNMITTVIRNLVNNAIKFTGIGSITVSCEAMNDRLIVSVTDTGVGMTEKTIKKLFRIDESHTSVGTSGEGGTGLGLIICREFVEKNKGEIRVESEQGKGSKFIFSLPTVQSEIKSDQIPFKANKKVEVPMAERTQDSDLTQLEEEEIRKFLKTCRKENYSILVIEDSKELRMNIVHLLSRHFNVSEADNGNKGIAHAKEFLPDLIISDVMMPEPDGFELCSTLKNDFSTSHIPIILLTSRSSDGSKLIGINKGADDYIVKPFQPMLLIARIKNLILQRRQLREKFSKEFIIQPTHVFASANEEQFLKRAIDVIEKKIDIAEFSDVDLAQETGMSNTQLTRKTEALTGMSPVHFIRLIRLKRASQLLVESNLNVNEIALSVGFNNITDFSKSFQEQFGMQPKEYSVCNKK